ncbi:MAG: DEAD/DEAH box helicase [Thermoproteota archaeon]|nr:DEAD/DEAH box helicase [Thermoproteota archaeon]
MTNDQENAITAWIKNRYKGSIIYSTGTGKTEIAFECARRAAINKCLFLKKDNNTNLDDFKILFLVPRIILIEQNIERLIRYNIDKESIGAYFGEKKNEREITISTYQSVINNHILIKNSDMVILDEVHFISDTAFSYTKLFKIIKEDPKKMILGLTATINELDPKYQEIIKTIPPVRRYLIKEAVDDGRLAKPEIISIEVSLTNAEKDTYDKTSELIRNISYKLNAYEPSIITKILYQGGIRSKYAKEWFSQVRIRKDLLNSSQNKLEKAVQIIKKHHNEKSMIFSETIESISKLKIILEKKSIPSEIIHSKIKIKDRKAILEKWGKDFFPLLSVHTLEIGYDIPQVGIAIILSNTSNINQIAQRIGRVIRKTEAKDKALIYVIHVKETRDNKIVKMVDKAVGKKSERLFKKTSTQTKITDNFK